MKRNIDNKTQNKNSFFKAVSEDNLSILYFLYQFSFSLLIMEPNITQIRGREKLSPFSFLALFNFQM